MGKFTRITSQMIYIVCIHAAVIYKILQLCKTFCLNVSQSIQSTSRKLKKTITATQKCAF